MLKNTSPESQLKACRDSVHGFMKKQKHQNKVVTLPYLLQVGGNQRRDQGSIHDVGRHATSQVIEFMEF